MRSDTLKSVEVIHTLLEPLILASHTLLLEHLTEQKLSSTAYSATLLKSTSAQSQLKDALRKQLTDLCQPTLTYELEQVQRARSCSEARWQRWLWSSLHLNGRNSFSTLVNQFGQVLWADGGLQFFKTYAVLARLIAITVDQWIEALSTLLTRLQQDQQALEQVFFDGHTLGNITAIQLNLSDAHHGGQSVIIVTFADNQTLVYKPRNLAIDETYNQMLSWFNEQDNWLDLKPLKLLSRPTYGWVEYVAARACQCHEEVQQYYRRAGQLVCLAYFLGSTDFHYENVIAHGQYPVLVDLETLMHPQLRLPLSLANSQCKNTEEAKEQESFAPKRLWNSVLKSGLLTRWDLTENGQLARDVSGLGGVPAPSQSRSYSNIPHLNQMPQRPSDYCNDIIRGFEHAYRLLMRLPHDHPILTGLCHASVRFVFRGTQLYRATLQSLLKPSLLMNGVSRSIELDKLNCSLVMLDKQPLFWPLTQLERRSLYDMDIPHFTVRADDTTIPLKGDDGIIAGLEKRCCEEVITRLQRFCEADLEEQRSLIREALSGATSGYATADMFYRQQLALMRDVGDQVGMKMAREQLVALENNL